MATTTDRYLSYPALAAGISRASSGGVAWSVSAWTEVVPASTITAAFSVTGFCFNFGPNTAFAVDNTHAVNFEFGVGAGGSEVMQVRYGYCIRIDSAIGHQPSSFLSFPEPWLVAANSRVAVRVAQSIATTVATYDGIKILYHIP